MNPQAALAEAYNEQGVILLSIQLRSRRRCATTRATSQIPNVCMLLRIQKLQRSMSMCKRSVLVSLQLNLAHLGNSLSHLHTHNDWVLLVKNTVWHNVQDAGEDGIKFGLLLFLFLHLSSMNNQVFNKALKHIADRSCRLNKHMPVSLPIATFTTNDLQS